MSHACDSGPPPGFLLRSAPVFTVTRSLCCFYLVILTVVHVSTTRLREGTRGTASHQATAAAVGGRLRCGGAVVSRVSRLTHSASISESPPWRRRAAQFPHGEWGKDGLSSRLRTTGVNSAGSSALPSSTPRHAESRQRPSRCWGGEDVSVSEVAACCGLY